MADSRTMTERYGGEVDNKRVIAQSARIMSESPTTLLVQGSVDSAKLVKSEGDEFKIAGVFSFFKKIFKDDFKPAKLAGAKFYIMVEVEDDTIQDYIVAAVDLHDGTFFEYTDAPITDELTKHVPRVNYNGLKDGE